MSAAKKKILVFIDWYLPGFKAGGPIKSCSSMVQRLHDEFDFRIVTGNTDLNESVQYQNIKSDEWNILEDKTPVFYCSAKSKNHASISKIIEEQMPDVVYLNSMFSPWFTLVPLMVSGKYKNKIKIVVAPRGMLSPGALALKPLKKKMFLHFAKLMRLFNNVTFHASTEIEVNEIKKVFGSKASIVHAINITPKTEIQKQIRTKTSQLTRLVYVGRISEVKNLLQCIHALGSINIGSSKIEFDIYGPVDEISYKQQCDEAIARLSQNIKVNFKGAIDNNAIKAILPGYHFLLLLTMNENYGHAIVESFTAGLPVIISNRTPWRQLENACRGWDLPLEDSSTISAALEKACLMDQHEYNKWSDAAYEFADSIHHNKKTLSDTIRLFEN
jgi:glycosyltransferase involved in cell wall biosynthesis